MYADDTNITTSGRSLSQIIHSVNTDLASVRDWLLANKLSINVAKTEQMFIGSDASLSKIQWQTQIFLDGIPITRVKSAKSIGVYIDERLSWAEHIDYLAKKVSSAIAGLRQVRPFTSIETALTIYQSLILPLFDYCDVVWDNLQNSTRDLMWSWNLSSAHQADCTPSPLYEPRLLRWNLIHRIQSPNHTVPPRNRDHCSGKRK